MGVRRRLLLIALLSVIAVLACMAGFVCCRLPGSYVPAYEAFVTNCLNGHFEGDSIPFSSEVPQAERIRILQLLEARKSVAKEFSKISDVGSIITGNALLEDGSILSFWVDMGPKTSVGKFDPKIWDVYEENEEPWIWHQKPQPSSPDSGEKTSLLGPGVCPSVVVRREAT